MTPPQTDTVRNTEILLGILECLRKQEDTKDQNHADHKMDKRRDSFSQICSMYAVIAIFIATLGVGFLSYAHDTFTERPEGTPPKITDEIVTSCLFSSVFLSISSSIALGFGASPTLIMSLPTKDAIRDLLLLLIAIGLPLPSGLGEAILMVTQKGRRPDGASIDELEMDAALASNALRKRATWPFVHAVARFHAALHRRNKLPSTESQFVIGMLLVAVVYIFLSLVALAIAIVTFAWTELGKRVAIFITASLFFPFTVVGSVVVIYKCTLARWNRDARARFEGKGNAVGVPLAQIIAHGH